MQSVPVVRPVLLPVLILALTLLTPACRRDPTNARIDPALAPLIPADTRAAAGLRLDKLKGTEFFRIYVAGKRIPQLDNFQRLTGLDPRQDLWELLFVTNGQRAVVLARGKFGGDFGQEPRIQTEGITRSRYKGYNLLTAKEVSVLFYGPTVALLGRTEDLQRIVDNRDNKNEVPPQALLDMVKAMPANTHAWLVARDAAALLPELPEQGNFANLARAVKNMSRLTVTANLAAGLDVKLDATYADETSAKQVNDAARGMLGLARLAASSKQPELLQALDAVKIQTAGSQLNVAANLPLAQLETAFH